MLFELLREGPARRIVWGSNSAGKFPGRDYFEGLDEQNQARFEALFERMADTGQIKNTEKFRIEGDGIAVFKIHKHRLACFFDGGDVVIVHGFGKKTPKGKREQRELKKAAKLRDDYEERKKRESNDQHQDS